MRARLLHNPSSGQVWTGLDLAKVVAELLPRGWCIDMVGTKKRGDATELARQAVQDRIDILIAAGGDGTLNEAVQGLAGSETVLGILPVGTTNVLARELGIPLNLPGALEVLHSGRETRIDLGMANGRYFILMVGIGYDAQFLQETDPWLKTYGGMLAHAVSATKTFFSMKSAKATFTADGRRFRRLVHQVIISNSQFYGPQFLMAPDASMTDGKLDVTIFRRRSVGDAVLQVMSVLMSKQREWKKVETMQVAGMTIATSVPLPYQIDGDTVGETPVTIEVAPHALRVLQSQEPRGWFQVAAGVTPAGSGK